MCIFYDDDYTINIMVKVEI